MMKRRGILNAQLSMYIAALGHTELFVIGDAGLPIPPGIPIVDLALCEGVPTFSQVFQAVLEEVVVEGYTIATEITGNNPELYRLIENSLKGVEQDMVPHETLKEYTRQAKFAIRTGEYTPYPNIILRAGVAF